MTSEIIHDSFKLDPLINVVRRFPTVYTAMINCSGLWIMVQISSKQCLDLKKVHVNVHIWISLALFKIYLYLPPSTERWTAGLLTALPQAQNVSLTKFFSRAPVVQPALTLVTPTRPVDHMLVSGRPCYNLWEPLKPPRVLSRNYWVSVIKKPNQ